MNVKHTGAPSCPGLSVRKESEYVGGWAADDHASARLRHLRPLR